MDALKVLPALRFFAIENAVSDLDPVDETDEHYFEPGITSVNNTIIREFFTYHVLLGNHSTLREVRLRYISKLKVETFETLFKIKGLKSLNFAGDEILINQQSFGSAITGTEGSLLPIQLENLTIEGVYGITDYDLQFLDYPTIILARLDRLTLAGFRKMMEYAEKLKKMVVFTYNVKYGEEEAELKDIARKNKIQLKIPSNT